MNGIRKWTHLCNCAGLMALAAVLMTLGSCCNDCDDDSEGRSTDDPTGTYILTGYFDSENPTDTRYTGEARVNEHFTIWFTIRRGSISKRQEFNIDEVDPNYYWDGTTLMFTVADYAGGYKTYTWGRG